ncbi:MAG TPA: enoyl-CoA hydratase-related protein [Acidimicrobiia bacterium]
MDEIQLGADEPVRLDVVDGIARLVLSRPAVRNAVSDDLLDGLWAALDSPVLDRAGALVLTGAGRGFCAGADLGALRAAVEGDAEAVLGPMVARLHAIVLRLRALPMPVVAAIEGAAVGGGMGLALAADLLVLGRSAVLVPGSLVMGASPDAGVSYFLARALGGIRATAALLLNEALDAPTLLAQGLATAVVDDGEALAAAMTLAWRVRHVPTGSLLATRRLVDLAPTHDLGRHLDAEEREFRSLWNGAEFREGVAAFLDGGRSHLAPPAPIRLVDTGAR